MTQPRPPRPTLCILNYNGSRYLPATLANVARWRDACADVLLVDDASTDDSVALAEQTLPDLRIVRQPTNRGPAAARNAALDRVRTGRALLLDNDVLPEPDVVERLMAALDDDPRAVIAQPRIVHADRPEVIQFEGATAHVSGLQALRLAEAPTREHPPGAAPDALPVDSLVSACFLIDLDRWAGRMDEAYEMYLEDHEFGLRARMLGHRVLAVPGAVCRHGEGTPGLSIRETGRHTARRVENTILDRWQTVLKLYETRTLVGMAPSLLLFELFQVVGSIGLGWGGHWWRALRRLVALRSDLIARRRRIQTARRAPDRAVLHAGPTPFNPALENRAWVRAGLGVLDAVTRLNWRMVAGGRAVP